jgi:hypothetical protein
MNHDSAPYATFSTANISSLGTNISHATLFSVTFNYCFPFTVRYISHAILVGDVNVSGTNVNLSHIN